MSLTREELIEYAERYVPDCADAMFPMNGDPFCILERETGEDPALKDDEGWSFSSYGICISYEIDPEAKPPGKWILFNFLSLATFPPNLQTIKLQPPHIVQGLFHNPPRTSQTRIIPVPLGVKKEDAEKKSKITGRSSKKNSGDGKILKFPK